MTFAIKKRKYLMGVCEYFAMAKLLLAFRIFHIYYNLLKLRMSLYDK